MNYFDLHCDTTYECYKTDVAMRRNGLAVSFDYAHLFDKWQQVFAVWISDDTKNPYGLYKKIIKDFKSKARRKPENLNPILAVEGGSVIERNINRLDKLREDGVKILTLTWNGENAIAGGSKSGAGLSRFGRKVIKRMNEIGLVCDFSHLNDKSFFSAIDIAERVIATHSNCRAIYDHKRNLTDEQLKLIADKGGIIGLCFFPGFLGGDTFQKIYENIYHMLELGLENHIAIGSDFDGADMDSRLENIGDIPSLYFRLSEKCINDRVLNKIFYENAANYMLNL